MRPTGLHLWLIAAIAAVALLLPNLGVWNFVIGTWIAVALVDAVLAYNQSAIEVSRTVSPNLSVNRETTVAIEVRNPESRTLRLFLQDETPRFTTARGAQRRLELAAGTQALVEYQLQATRRGDGDFGDVSLLIESPFRLWELRRRKKSENPIRVFPDFAAISQYLELVSDQKSQRLGLKVRPRRGDGLEFHQLHEYHPNEGIRSIDWKATARRRSLISRQYTVERDQRVVFLLDSGSRMRAKDGALSHFDHALNAMLLLSHVALRQGDTVTLKTFGPTNVWLPELRGVGAINQLLNAVYRIQTGLQTADFVGAAEELMQQQRKRSLIVLMTNLREEDSDLEPALNLLRRRHVVLLASLRESAVDQALATPVRSFDQALSVAGASRYLAQRKQAQAGFSKNAHVLIDCVPNQLPIKLVNSYWQLKRAGTL